MYSLASRFREDRKRTCVPLPIKMGWTTKGFRRPTGASVFWDSRRFVQFSPFRRDMSILCVTCDLLQLVPRLLARILLVFIENVRCGKRLPTSRASVIAREGGAVSLKTQRLTRGGHNVGVPLRSWCVVELRGPICWFGEGRSLRRSES